MTEDQESEEFTDDRAPGQYRTRYDRRAWTQIIAELTALLFFTVVLSFTLFIIALSSYASVPHESLLPLGLNWHEHRMLLNWICTFIAGAMGGITFDLKWLYHSVAKGKWNHDRVLWRLQVPLLSGVVATFVMILMISGLLPALSTQTFERIYAYLGGGFLIGYFSDNFLAALQRFANIIFGVTEDKQR